MIAIGEQEVMAVECLCCIDSYVRGMSNMRAAILIYRIQNITLRGTTKQMNRLS